MIRIALLLLGLPTSVLLALVVALACLFALLLLLIAFVPCMSERVSAIISALRRK